MGSQNVLSYLNRENEKPYLSQRRSSLLNCFSVQSTVHDDWVNVGSNKIITYIIQK